MRYANMVPGIFRKRPNRFIAHVEIGGAEQVVHVKNTGRCRELLVPGALVWCQHSDNPARKTQYDLIAVQKGERLINMDSQAPNAAARSGWQAAGWEKSTICARRRCTGTPGLIFPLLWMESPVFWRSRA